MASDAARALAQAVLDYDHALAVVNVTAAGSADRMAAIARAAGQQLVMVAQAKAVLEGPTAKGTDSPKKSGEVA